MISGDLDGVEPRLDDAEAALMAGAEDERLAASWADTDDLRTAPATIWVFRASLAQARGDVSGTFGHARRALELAATEDHFVKGAASAFLGLASWAVGDVRGGLTTFAAAVRSLHSAGNLVDELDGTIVLADMWVASGRPRRARRLCELALSRAIDGGGRYVRATADLHVALAELDCEVDDLISAEEHLETARVLAGRTSITENRHRWFVAMSRVRAAGGDYDTAIDLLDRAEALYRHGFYPDVRPVSAMKARVQIASGDLLSAAAWAADQGLSVDDSPEFLREYEHLTLARLLLAQHRIDRHRDRRGTVPLATLAALLDRLHATALDTGRDGSTLEILLLQALTHHARGDLPTALAALCDAMDAPAEPDGYVRVFLDERAPMMALLYQAASVTDRHSGAERGGTVQMRARRLLERAQSIQGREPSRPGAEALSQREIQVIRLLDSELTGPEIALEMYVTLNTLRTHTKRIFIKLDVKTRATAVQRARERGLL
jgi:LuxR family maltose regulon positive regulatory protein